MRMTALSVTSHVLLMTNIPADQPLGGGWTGVGWYSGVYVAEVPWAYPGSRFTKDFDLTVAWFASYLPRSTTSYFMRVDWETVGRCVNRALHDLEPERSRILVVILTSHLLFILIVAVNMCQLRGVKPLKQCREVILTAVILMITLASNRSTP